MTVATDADGVQLQLWWCEGVARVLLMLFGVENGEVEEMRLGVLWTGKERRG